MGVLASEIAEKARQDQVNFVQTLLFKAGTQESKGQNLVQAVGGSWFVDCPDPQETGTKACGINEMALDGDGNAGVPQLGLDWEELNEDEGLALATQLGKAAMVRPLWVILLFNSRG